MDYTFKMNSFSSFGNFYTESYEEFLQRKKKVFTQNGYYSFIESLSNQSLEQKAKITEPSSQKQHSVGENSQESKCQSSNKPQPLTVEDLKTYHKLFLKFIGPNSHNVEEKLNTINLKDLPQLKDKSDLRLFKYLHGKVVLEQKKFHNLAERLASTDKCAPKPNNLQSDLSNYAQEIFEARKSSAMNLYPRFYVCRDVISAANSPNKKATHLAFKFLKLCQQTGVPCGISLPQLDSNSPLKLTKSLPSIQSRFQICPQKSSQLSWKSNALMKDDFGMTEATNCGAEFLTSSRCLLTVLNHLTDLCENWDIPVTVTEQNKRKLIIMGNPLPKPNMTEKQKNYILSKLCCRILLESPPSREVKMDSTTKITQKTNSPNKLSKELQELKKSIVESPKLILDIPDSASSERVLTRSQRKRQSSQMEVEEKVQDESQLESDEDLQIDLSAAVRSPQVSIINTQPPVVYKKMCLPEEIEEPSSPTDSSSVEVNQPKVIPLEAGEEVQVEKTITPPKRISLDTVQENDVKELCHKYALCEFSDKKLMIRYREHGMKMASDDQQGVGLCHQSLYLQLKLEYQEQYGSECLSWREMWQAWLALLIREDATLIRVRCSANEGNILMLENEKIQDLLKKYSNFKPQQALRFLDNVLTKLQNLPVGQYLLRHRSTDQNDCLIFQATMDQNKRPPNSIDLRHNYLFTQENVSVRSEWLPIDTRLFNLNHLTNESVPAVFAPNQSANISSDHPNQRKPRAKRKKKSKKKNVMNHSKS